MHDIFRSRQNEITRTRNIYWSLLKKRQFIAWIRLYLELLFLCGESSIYRHVHVHVSRRVNREAQFFCTLRGPAFSDGLSEIDGSGLTRLYFIFVRAARDVRVLVNSTISRKSTLVSGGARAIHTWALGTVSRFSMLRFCKLNKFTAANYFAFFENISWKQPARAERRILYDSF